MPLYPFTSPPSTLSFSIFYFFFFYSLHLFSCLSIYSHSTRIVPHRFQAGRRRRRLNLALVFYVLILCYVYFLVKDACLFLGWRLRVDLIRWVSNVSPSVRPSIHYLSFSLLLFPFFLFVFALPIFFYCPSDPFLPESSHSVIGREVVGGDRTWI